jgi:Uma2 family endonuclease
MNRERDVTIIAEPFTSDEMLALPDQDSFERWLIEGELREQITTLRSPTHAGTSAAITGYLLIWLLTLPKPRPKLYNGDIYFRLCCDPETNVGSDVALATAEQAAATGLRARFIDGAPLLAVEVLSPSDVVEAVHEKIGAYLEANTSMVWLVDPYQSTVTVYRPGEEPVLFNRNQELVCEPILPGFRIRVADLFQ